MNSKLEEKLSQNGTVTICPAAVIFKDNQILMGKRNYSSEFSVWILPGGRCEKEETVEMTLRREVQEEIGITDLIIKDFIGQIPGLKDGDVLLIFFCSSEQEVKLMEPKKFECWQWFHFDEYKKDMGKAHDQRAKCLVVEYLEKNIFL
jgi:8-oxo-dGTP pyrophosphatase MutT (NUDIX family)